MLGARALESCMKMISQFRNIWSLKRDYRAAKDAATARIIRRQARGNVSVQNGWYMTRAKLLRLSRSADKKLEALRQAAH